MFTLRLTEEIEFKIAVIANEEKRSKNAEIEYILEKYIKEYEEKNGKIIYK